MKKRSILIFFVIILYIGIKYISTSVFIKGKDRVNIIFYGPNTTFYSLGFNDVNYFFSIPSNLEVEVPGGYGYYRIGGLSKFISLQKKPDLFRKTFSSVSSSFVDFYFYPRKNEINYNGTSERFSPGVKEIMTNGSNANLIDRLIIWLYFLGKPSTHYKEINTLPQKREDNKSLFDRDEFFKLYQGFFYKKTHRIIKDRVQVLYTKSYTTASLISNILEGEGIQVVDLTQTNEALKSCKVEYSSEKKSIKSAKDIADFFGCQLEKGETEVSDIILTLGNLEIDWEVK